MDYFLGVDVGSSKTHALIADQTGTCRGFGKAWGGNHQVVGYDGLESVLKESAEAAMEMAGVSRAQIRAAGFGAAGYDFPSDREPHLKAISTLGLSCPVDIMNDGMNGLFAGTTRGVGVNVTAGTSVNCRGRNKDGKQGRIVGNGAMFGEFGGGLEVVMRALQRVNYAWIRRLPPTSLTNMLLEATGAKDESDLMEGLSNETYHLFPHLAVEIVKAAQNGDVDSREILRWAGEELGWLAVAVTRQIQMEHEAVEIVQSGSLFEAGGLISDPMREVILSHIPKAKIVRLKGLPVVGSVLLGMEQIGFDGYRVRERLIRTTKEISGLD